MLNFKAVLRRQSDYYSSTLIMFKLFYNSGTAMKACQELYCSNSAMKEASKAPKGTILFAKLKSIRS